MNKLWLLLGTCLLTMSLTAQDYVYQTFKDTRIINTHSVEMVPKRKMDFRIIHRFGDLAGNNGGYSTFFGLENASDVLIGFEYGASNNLNIGIYRTKGAGSLPDGTSGLRQLLNASAKYRLMAQQDGGNPVTITLLGIGTMSTANKIEGADIIGGFPKFAHRLAYAGQLLIARKYSDSFSMQITPSYVYRNLVAFQDENGLFSLGVAGRVQLSKVFGLVLDATVPFSSYRNDGNFYPAIGLGIEVETGGHVFQINLTNATAIMETDYIPYTTTNWGDGEFRLGFTVSRMFNL